MSSANTARYEDLPRSYHIFKWRILLAFAGFYLFLYLGRFNFWPVAPLVKEDLALSNFEIGLVNALLKKGTVLPKNRYIAHVVERSYSTFFARIRPLAVPGGPIWATYLEKEAGKCLHMTHNHLPYPGPSF